MNKRNIVIITILIAVVAIAIAGATLTVLTAHTPYNDTNIKLEVPQGTEFQQIQSNTSLEYISTNPNLHISIVSLDPNYTSLNETYSQGKSNLLKKLKNKKINESEHDYKGMIYNTTNKTNNEAQYSIVLFNDSTYSTVVIASDDLNTVIKAAETFKLLKPYIIKLPEVGVIGSNAKKAGSNSTDDLALGFLYGYIYGYYDGSSSYDSSYNSDYYDDSYYDDSYYDDSYYDDYDDYNYEDYNYDDSYY